MKKPILLVSALGVVLLAGPALAGEESLLRSFAGGAFDDVVGDVFIAGIDHLGVFETMGLGRAVDTETIAKLDEILTKLDQVEAGIVTLQGDLTDLNTTIKSLSDAQVYRAVLDPMADAQSQIQTCAQQLGFAAKATGTDDADATMRGLARQIVGRGGSGPCDLTTHFNAIHLGIVPDSSAEGVYKLLARVARDGGLPFEQVASHFVQYAVTQREALRLIRGAYTILGETDNLDTALNMGSTALLPKLRAEEIAFLEATDEFITHGSPPFDTSSAAFADAIVQRLEGVRSELTTFSLGLFPEGAQATPYLKHSDGHIVSLSDVLQSSPLNSYYNATDIPGLRAGNARCEATTSDGISYVRPNPSGSGFLIGSTCDLHLTRQLLLDVPANIDTDDWILFGRTGQNVVGYTYRNAATLNSESRDDELILGGDGGGHASGMSAFALVTDIGHPGQVSLSIDVPGQGALPIRRGNTQPLTAGGTGTIAWFDVKPYGPEFPDRHALGIEGKYVAVDSRGYAVLSDAEQWFDFLPAPGDRTELAYDSSTTDDSTLYVNAQLKQVFFGESPDERWWQSVNVAVGPENLRSWGVPSDGVPRAQPDTGLHLYPPCLDANGTPMVGYSTGEYGSEFHSECGIVGLSYVTYTATFTNEGGDTRSFQLDSSAVNTLVPGQSSGTSGIHCYQTDASGGDHNTHLDYGPVDVSTEIPFATVGPATFGPFGPEYHWNLTLAPGTSMELACQAYDADGYPADISLTNFTVTPCQITDGTECKAYL